ncbi:MAG: hypothetical protein AABY15_09080 [Nanoarchaeota archaeon]
MIGTIFFPSNDIYVFLSDEEFKKIDLERRLEGDFINSEIGVKGSLKFFVRENIRDTAKYLLDKGNDGKVKNLEVFVYGREYEAKSPGEMSFHLGYSHVNILNISSLRFNEQGIYNFLCQMKTKSF